MEYTCVPSSLPTGIKAIPDYWCSTKAKVVKFSYNWAIHDYSLCCEKLGLDLQSSTFPASANNELQWFLRIPPKGSDEEYLSPCLTLISSNKPEVKAHFKLSILNAKQEQIYARESEYACFFTKGSSCTLKKFIRRDYLLNKENDLLFNDVLTIFCEISIVDKTVNTSGQLKIEQFKDSERILAENLGNLFITEKFSDVTLAVLDGREFQAHKAILAARSEVFAAMFEYEMKEKSTNRITITDIEPEVLKEMLHFMYTGTAPNLDGMADGLLAAADKYALKNLKEMCEKTLCVNLSVEMAAETLILADLHSADQLKERTINFITSHATNVVKTTAWQNLEATHSHLIAETFVALVTQ